jgi:hypothetical protein
LTFAMLPAIVIGATLAPLSTMQYTTSGRVGLSPSQLVTVIQPVPETAALVATRAATETRARTAPNSQGPSTTVSLMCTISNIYIHDFNYRVTGTST